MGFSKKKIISALLFFILVISIPVGMYLTRQVQTGKSRASENIQDRDRSKIKKVGTYLFYWFDCDKQNPSGCPDDLYAYQALGMRKDDQYVYSPKLLNWYKNEFKDMNYAGIDYVFPVSMGQVPVNSGIYVKNVITGKKDPFGYPFKYQSHDILIDRNNPENGNLVKAIRETNVPLKVGFFDDMTSVIAENNDLSDDGSINGSNYCAGRDWFNEVVINGNDHDYRKPCQIYTLSFPDSRVINIEYDRKIKDFFSNVPKDLWATHNGAPVDQGGRPIIIFYFSIFSDVVFNGPASLSPEKRKVYAMKAHFREIKDRFRVDFGVEPFLVTNPFDGDYGSDMYKREYVGIFDAHIGWTAGYGDFGKAEFDNIEGRYITAWIGPGQNGERLDDIWKDYNQDPNFNVYVYNSRSKDLCIDDMQTTYNIQQCQRRGGNNCGVLESDTSKYCKNKPETGEVDFRFRQAFSKILGEAPVDLMMIETWNEWTEGTGIARAVNWPREDSPGNRNFSSSNKSEDTIYMTSLRNLLGFSPTAPPERIVTSTPAPVVTTPSPGNRAPVGFFDGVDNASCKISGWVKDEDTPNQSVKVHVYKDVKDDGSGGEWLAEFTAGEVRSDVGGNFGYNVTLPLQDNRDHKIAIYGMDTKGENNNTLLTGSPKTIHCPVPATTIQSIISLFGQSGNPSQGDQNSDGKLNELDFGAVYSR